MAQSNVRGGEAPCVLVYHGPRGAGTTETLRAIRRAFPRARRSDVVARPSGVHPSLFVEHLRLHLRPSRPGDASLPLDLVALPEHEALPLLVDLLRVADGVVFVADARATRVPDDRAALRNLERALARAGVDLARLPLAFQWNKRDLPAALPPDDLALAVGARGRPCFCAAATRGEGVLGPLREVVVAALRRRQRRARARERRAGGARVGAGSTTDPAVPSFGGRRRGAARGCARGAA